MIAFNSIPIILLTSLSSFMMEKNLERTAPTTIQVAKPPVYKPISASLLIAIQRQFNKIENDILSAAAAMPEEKFYFSPADLSIQGSAFTGVRNFAAQIKHLATDNFHIWCPISGVPLRSDITDVNGPESIKTKTAIMEFLKESFAVGRKAIQLLTKDKAMEMIEFRGRKLPRLDLAFYALTHANEHYGQMAVYLRMCGIVPPATVNEYK